MYVSLQSTQQNLLKITVWLIAKQNGRKFRTIEQFSEYVEKIIISLV